MFTFPFTLFVGSAATRTYVTSPATQGSATTYNFGTLSLGTAQGTSLVVIIFHGFNNGASGQTLSSATINGVSATIHAQATGNTLLATALTAICSATVSASSGNVTCVCNNTMTDGAVDVYRLNNLVSATPTATATAIQNSGTSLSTTINIPGNGVLILGVGDDGATPSVTGASNDVTQAPGASHTWGGSNDTLAQQTNRTLSASFSSSTASLVGVAWN